MVDTPQKYYEVLVSQHLYHLWRQGREVWEETVRHFSPDVQLHAFDMLNKYLDDIGYTGSRNFPEEE